MDLVRGVAEALKWVRAGVHFLAGEPREDMRGVIAIVRSMPDEMRQVFTLRKVYGFEQSEIARCLGMSESAVAENLVQAALRIARYYRGGQVLEGDIPSKAITHLPETL